MSQDYTPALWMPANGHWWPGHDNRRKWVIIHGTAGGSSAQGVAEWFATSSGNSTHYIIGQDGTVVQCVAEEDTAWGNGPKDKNASPWWDEFVNCNPVTFSIEHVKPHTDNSDAITPAQQDASFKLVEHLCEKWAVPTHPGDETGGICGHDTIMPETRANCPGPYPWSELFVYLNRNAVPLPLGVTDDGTTLHFPGTANVVVRGFRDYLRKGAAWWLGAPRTNELPSHNVRLNTTMIPGVFQVFEFGVLAWEQATGAIYPLQGGDVLYSLAQKQVSDECLAKFLS